TPSPESPSRAPTPPDRHPPEEVRGPVHVWTGPARVMALCTGRGALEVDGPKTTGPDCRRRDGGPPPSAGGLWRGAAATRRRRRDLNLMGPSAIGGARWKRLVENPPVQTS